MEQLQASTQDHLTESEAAEIARITNDADVIAYAILDMEGYEVATGGAWSTMLVPVFGNTFDLAHRIGDEIGEEDTCSMLFIEGSAFETISITLSAARAVFLKRKTKNVREGLRSVS